MEEFLRTVLPALLALVTTWGFDRATRRRGLDPPGFAVPATLPGDHGTLRQIRRGIALSALCAVLWIGVFLPLGAIGTDQEVDIQGLTVPQLFMLHGILILCVAVWYVCGFVFIGIGSGPETRSWKTQLGFRAKSIWRELGLGLIAGVGAWLLVLVVLVVVGMTIWWLGGEEMLPQQPPPLIPWIAALPLGFKLLVSVSAGVSEEIFFRGFLQPRMGLAASTGLFVLAHASYEQPIMLVGILILSLVYGLLAQWRQTIWPAIAAHALFDAVQLLVVIPTALDLLPDKGEGVLVPVAALFAFLRLGLG
ncbi:MAG: CPBP family intramembrane metalloprotease [Acidobacteriota bacterium]|jgi:membrane protease YdiL (CAAX protease family)